MHISYNPNPESSRVGDCVIRAIAKATNQSWKDTYIAIALQGYIMHDMPSANRVWGAYLRSKGFQQRHIECNDPDSYTVANFAADNPNGIYILALSGHVVCICNGDWYDTWDSGGETPIYYWEAVGNV